jgi:hypothetical protein
MEEERRKACVSDCSDGKDKYRKGVPSVKIRKGKEGKKSKEKRK